MNDIYVCAHLHFFASLYVICTSSLFCNRHAQRVIVLSKREKKNSAQINHLNNRIE